MKRKSKSKRRSELLEEYDFSRAQRGKYARRYREGMNVVVFDARKICRDLQIPPPR